MAIEIKCAVSSCLSYNSNYDFNCSTFYAGGLNSCKRFTQEKAEELPTEPKTVADITEEKKLCGRQIYF